MIEGAERCPSCGYPQPEDDCGRCHGTVRSPRTGDAPRRGPGILLRDLVEGFVSLFAGALSLLHDREYVGKLTLPILANLVTLTLAFFGLFWGLWEGFAWLMSTEWGFLDFLRAPTGFVAGAAALVLATISLWLLAPVLIETVTAPFLDPIAEATETAWIGAASPAVDPGFWQSTLSGLRATAHVLLVQLALLVPLLLLSLTGIGAVFAALIAGWLNALIWFEVPCSRRGYSMRQRRALLRRNWARALGFGVAFQLGIFVPFFNLLLLTPAAAVATSALYFRFDKGPALASDKRRGTVPDPAGPPA